MRRPQAPGPAPASTRPPVRIVPYVPGSVVHRDAYRALNLAWIEAHFAVEDRDRRELDDPEGHILAAGGQIFMAESDTVAEGPHVRRTEVLGTCALLREPDGSYELAKMAVQDTARGRGVGRALGAAAVAAARAAGAARVDLLSNTVLGPAIALYRALGFVEVPLPATEYARANIKMVLDLSDTRSGVRTGRAVQHPDITRPGDWSQRIDAALDLGGTRAAVGAVQPDTMVVRVRPSA